MRPKASLELEQVFHERLLVSSGFQLGRCRTSQVRVSKAWRDTICYHGNGSECNEIVEKLTRQIQVIDTEL